MHGYQRRQAVHLYLYYAGNWNKQTQIEFYEKKLDLHHNFVDVVQSKRKNLGDGNDIIAYWTSKRSAVFPAESTDPIIGNMKFLVCNSICDVKTVDSASVLMNDEDAHFDDEVDEPPASLVQELPLIKDCAGQLATIARGSLFPEKVAATCILQVAKAAITLPTPNNQPRSVALEVQPIMRKCVLPRTEEVINLTEQVHQKLLKHYFNTGKAVDHSIMASRYPWCSNTRMKLQGFRTSAKSKYNILNEFYHSAMQQISDKCDAPPCQHLIDFTCNLCDQCSDMLMYFPSSLTLS